MDKEKVWEWPIGSWQDYINGQKLIEREKDVVGETSKLCSKSSWFPFSNLEVFPLSLFSCFSSCHHPGQSCRRWCIFFLLYSQHLCQVSLPPLLWHEGHSHPIGLLSRHSPQHLLGNAHTLSLILLLSLFYYHCYYYCYNYRNFYGYLYSHLITLIFHIVIVGKK